MSIVNVYDLLDEESGLTYREKNMLQTHNIPIGSLVEIVSRSDEEGMRLMVIEHGRDCDGTPLYTLGHRMLRASNELSRGFESVSYLTTFNRGISCGPYSENSLKVIRSGPAV